MCVSGLWSGSGLQHHQILQRVGATELRAAGKRTNTSLWYFILHCVSLTTGATASLRVFWVQIIDKINFNIKSLSEVQSGSRYIVSPEKNAVNEIKNHYSCMKTNLSVSQLLRDLVQFKHLIFMFVFLSAGRDKEISDILELWKQSVQLEVM